MRKLAFEVVEGTLERGGHSDDLFHHVIQTHPVMTAQEKRFLKRLSYGAIERKIEMDARIDAVSTLPARKMRPAVRTILRMALYEIYYMEQVPNAAACHEAVELTKKKKCARYSSFVNAVLRNAIRDPLPLEKQPDWIRYSLPEELMEHLRAQYGKKTAGRIAASYLEQSGTVTLHIDSNKIRPEQYGEELKKRQISFWRGNYIDQAIVVEHIQDISTLPGYRKGWFFVQDESSMLPVLCAGIRPGMRVADVCSAPGGKTMHALIQLKGEGWLTARDVSEKKVEKIRENIERFGYSNVCCECRDARVTDEKNKGKMDVVLVDVPCSGIGIIGRKPEIKYHAMEDAAQLIERQRQICRAGAELLKPGGVLIYSTCTINCAENEENVRWMEEHLGLHTQSLDAWIPQSLQNKMTAGGMLQMLPGLQKSDGFFVSRLTL